MKIAFVTDSGTGKSVGELAKEGIYSVPLQVSCDNKNYQDLEELSIDEIYALMRDGKMLSTSLPSLGKIEELFQGLKQQGYEQIFAVPICSGLSGTINAMEMIAQQQGIAFDYVDCHVTAVVQEYMIKLAKQLHETGKSIDQIKEVLLRIVHTTNTYLITVAHADDEAEALVYMEKLKQAFPNAAHQIIKLVSVVGVHTGRGCQAVQYFKQIKE